jgi:glucan phosphoethanolaminetransferase (alkaline phosphatase superfamily)
MIQRIQTLFLAVVAIGMGVFLSMPVWQKASVSGVPSVAMDAFKTTHQIDSVQSNIQSVVYLSVLAVLIAGVAIYAIFQYRNRLLQSALCAVNSVLMTALLATTVYKSHFTAAQLFDPQLPGDYLPGFYGLVAAMLANVFANRFIRRDEKVIRESNRMR